MSRYPSIASGALLVACLLLLGGVVPASGGAPTETRLNQISESRFDQAQQQWEPWTNTTMELRLESDGDARWTISTTVNLEDDQDLESFQSLATDFESGDEPAPGLNLIQEAAANVDTRTERQMQVVDIERGSTPSSELEVGGSGRLFVQFTWENFARVDDERLHVDDVLVTTDGSLWLPSLEEGLTFVMVGPEGYGIQANPGSDGTLEANQLRWEGPTTFEQANLEATFIGSASPPPGDDDGDDTPGTDGSEGSSTLLWLIVPMLLAGAAVAVVVARMANLDLDVPRGKKSEASSSPTAEGDGESTSATTAEAEQSTASETEAEQSASSETEDEEIDAELLSDEERVERLLEENGGRMKQATIVKETDWSDAKVSQLLSTMEEDDRIDKLRIGRENLISFPEEDVTEIDE